MIQLAQREPEFAAVGTTRDTVARDVIAELVAAGMASDASTADVEPDRAAQWIMAITDAGYLISDDAGFDTSADGAELRRIIAADLGRG